VKAQLDVAKDGVAQPAPAPSALERLPLTPGVPHSRVGITVGTQLEFGRIKVTAHVEFECDQNERAVNEAGMLAFNKATEFMNDGLSWLVEKDR
jgi:hypothetical protein